jgi:Ca2+ transporting ATPase
VKQNLIEMEEHNATFGITLKELRELMELRGNEAQDKMAAMGGVQELCKRLASSPVNGTEISQILQI